MTSGTEKRARTRHLTIRFTPEERATVDGNANRAGLTTGSYVRQVVLGATPPRQVRRPPIERQELARLLGEIGKVGSNLNQLAHAANSGTVLDTVEIVAALDSLGEVRTAILSALGRST